MLGRLDLVGRSMTRRLVKLGLFLLIIEELIRWNKTSFFGKGIQMVVTLFRLMSLFWKVFLTGQPLGNCYGTIWCL